MGTSVNIDGGEEGNVCDSEGPSLLCSRVRGEGGGLWGRLATAVLSIQALPAHWTRVMHFQPGNYTV